MKNKYFLCILVMVMVLVSSITAPKKAQASYQDNDDTGGKIYIPYVVNATTRTSEEEYILYEEERLHQVYDDYFEVVPMSELDRIFIRTLLKNPGLFSIGVSTIVVNEPWGPPVVYDSQDTLNFVSPAVKWGSDSWYLLYKYITDVPMYSREMWIQLFHWIHHTPDIYRLGANAEAFATVIQGALNGNGLIYYLEGAGGVRSQYMFVQEVVDLWGKHRSWVVIVHESGAIITGYDPSIKNSLPRSGEYAKFLAKMFARGYREISPSEVPSGIIKNWGNNRLPLLRIWWWAVSFQARYYMAMLGTTFSQAITDIANFVGGRLITIPILFFWPGCPDQICNN